MLNKCKQLWVSRAAQALDARLSNHVVVPSVNPALRGPWASARHDIKIQQIKVKRFLSGRPPACWPRKWRGCGGVVASVLHHTLHLVLNNTSMHQILVSKLIFIPMLTQRLVLTKKVESCRPWLPLAPKQSGTLPAKRSTCVRCLVSRASSTLLPFSATICVFPTTIIGCT